MSDRPIPLELLAPAKNAEYGMVAIDHGADAVYIGGPAFGARSGASNRIEEIEQLARHAHRYHAKVLVALNTILHEHELEEARDMAWQVWRAGADALIVQDMGLLQMDLPPIQLHASTQTDNRTLEKVKFLEDVGFSQVVLARELTLPEIRHIANGTDAALEFFIHGALCVSYSGQCYISHAHTGRSANRGECSQACRLPYTLKDTQGRVVAWNKHLLSLKDNDQSDNLRLLADAGIRSFKIEGRLKDLSYVKNITAHYRQLLDELMAEKPRYVRSSSGVSQFTFTPRPEKTFNRGSTDYFVSGRQTDIGAFDSPAFMGESVGIVTAVDKQWFELQSAETLHNGDGLSWFDSHGERLGIRINKVEARGMVQRLHVALAAGQWLAMAAPELSVGTEMFRNRDQEFERQLEKRSAERFIRVKLTLSDTESGFALAVEDEDGLRACVEQPQDKQAAKDPERALEAIRDSLGKLGGSGFSAQAIEVQCSQAWFLPASFVNGLRRAALEALEQQRLSHYQRPERALPKQPAPLYPATDLSYLGNVLNSKARAFYEAHGVQVVDAAYEANQELGEVPLMITRHCLRYSFSLCPKEVKGIKPDPMTLMNGKEKLTLVFDCKRCEMQVHGKIKKSVLQAAPSQTIQFHSKRPEA